MTLQQLQYALALQQNESYSRAAKSVGISQPAMSIQIRKLEEEMGLNLFDRSHKRVQVTDQGKRFLEQAQLLLTFAKQLRSLANELREELSGVLQIGIIPTLAPYLLPLFIDHLHASYPTLKLNVIEALTEEVIQGIKTGNLDAGIISTPIDSAYNFAFTPLFYEGLKLFVSENHPLFKEDEVAVAQIPINDIWLLKEGNCFRDQVDNLCDLSRLEHSQDLFYFESNSIEALCRIVEFKGGVTFLPELTTISFSAEREPMIKKLSGPKRVREISLIYLPTFPRMQTLELLGKAIRQNIPRTWLEKGDAQALPTNVKIQP